MTLPAKFNQRRQFFKRSLVVAAGATAFSAFETVQSVAAAPAAAAVRPGNSNAVSGFLVEANGIALSVSHCTGLGSRNNIVLSKAAGLLGSPSIAAYPGDLYWLPVTLTTTDLQERFWIEWRNSVEQGKINRVNITITAFNDTGTQIARWGLTKAWPSVVVFQPNDLSFVKLITLVHEGLTRIK